jgi:predicted PurR-regulated permease PerM
MDLTAVNKGRFVWWLLGLVLGAAVLFVAYSFVGTFVFGIFIYYATRPIYRQIRRGTNHPNVAAAVSLFALVLPALLLVAYAVAIVLQELDRYARATRFDPAEYGIDPELLNRIADPAMLLQQGGVREYLTGPELSGLLASLDDAVGTVAVLGIAAVHLFVMLAFAFYLLRDDHRISRWFYHRFGDDKGVVHSYLHAVDRDFNSIFFGNILNAVLTGSIGVIAYSALNVIAPPELKIPAPALVGLLAGVASLIPVVGMKLVYVPVAIFLLAQAVLGSVVGGLVFVAIFTVISLVVVDTIPDLVLRPYVSGRSLHVGAVMLAYTLGPLLFGWYGIFLMPMLLVLVVHFVRIVLPELLTGTPIEPYAIDPTYMSVETAPFDDDATTGASGADSPSDSGSGFDGGDPVTDGNGEAESGGDDAAGDDAAGVDDDDHSTDDAAEETDSSRSADEGRKEK